jgi:hypothetical protein
MLWARHIEGAGTSAVNQQNKLCLFLVLCQSDFRHSGRYILAVLNTSSLTRSEQSIHYWITNFLNLYLISSNVRVFILRGLVLTVCVGSKQSIFG